MKTKKVFARLAFLGIFCLLTQACASEETKPNYEVTPCTPIENPTQNLDWLKEKIEFDLKLRQKGMEVYTANLNNKFVYVIKDVGSEYIYNCTGKALCKIYDALDSDPNKCATMLKSITNKKLIYQH
jgi:hypothetical protein